MHEALLPYQSVNAYQLSDLLSEHSRSRPHRIAVIDGDLRYTYLQLNVRVIRLSNMLSEQGVQSGDRVLWFGQNSFRVIELLFACARLGAILCPANWRVSAREAIDILDDLDPKIVFWQAREIGDVIREARAGCQNRGDWICHDGVEGEPNYELLLNKASLDKVFTAVAPSNPVLAIYTAAFSGRPGAALISHETLMLVAWLSLVGQQINEESGYLVSGPMFHVGVLLGTLGTIMAGGRAAIVARVEAENLLQMIQTERLTHAYIVRPTIEQMREINANGKYDVSSIFSDPLMSDYASPLVMPRTAPMMQNMNGYGQTEIGGLVVASWLGGNGAGRPAPFLQIKIADDKGNEVPNEEVGEILARGPLVMRGYWNRPEENARRVIDGWHSTHDLGRRLPDGSIVFVGPKTTMIKSGLENIYPAEVEACLRRYPGVTDVCVIGVPDPKWSQNVKAIIVRDSASQINDEALIEHCRQYLASYKKPKVFLYVDSLPRDANGQIDRKAIDRKYDGGGYPSVG